MNILIREARIDDFPAIHALIVELAVFEKLPDKVYNSVEKMVDEKEFFHCFVAETENDEIIGYATHFFAYFTWVGKSLYMDDLYVKQEFRGNGIGTMLINRVVEFARKSNCHRLRWQVSNWNHPAIKFYQSLGAEINTIEQNCDINFD